MGQDIEDILLGSGSEAGDDFRHLATIFSLDYQVVVDAFALIEGHNLKHWLSSYAATGPGSKAAARHRHSVESQRQKHKDLAARQPHAFPLRTAMPHGHAR